MPRALLIILLWCRAVGFAPPANYYTRSFRDFSRESPYLSVAVRIANKPQKIIVLNSEFSRLLCAQYHLNFQEYVALMSSKPLVRNTVQLNLPVQLENQALYVPTCSRAKSTFAEPDPLFLKRYTHVSNGQLWLNSCKDIGLRRCLIEQCIVRSYYVTTDDESGYLMVSNRPFASVPVSR